MSFVSNKNQSFRTPEASTSFDQVSRATPPNQMNGTGIARTKSPETQGIKSVHATLSQASPHLRHTDAIGSPPTDFLNKRRIPRALDIEARIEVMPPPYISATTLSDLTILSELDISDAKEIMPAGNDKPQSNPMAQGEKKPAYASRQSCKHEEPAGVDGNKIVDDPIIGCCPPHLRPRKEKTAVPVAKSTELVNGAKYQNGACGLKAAPASVVHQHLKSNSPIPITEGRQMIASATNDNITPRANLASSTNMSPLTPKTISDTKPLHIPRVALASQKNHSAWRDFSAAPGASANRSGSSARTGSTNQLPAQTGGYGIPIIPKAPVAVDPALQKALFFQSWPGVEERSHISRPRTIIITELPKDPTLAMISRICKNTGLLEAVSLFPGSRKALVWYIEADDAKRFYDKTGNGIVLDYEREGNKFKKTVFVAMKKEVDVLPSALRTKVDVGGHTRVIRIVGWQMNDLKLILGHDCTGQEGPETLLRKLAQKCAFERRIERIEGVTCHTNALGHLEASLIFSGMKEAYFALGQIRKMRELEACNITFGKDPCERMLPVVSG